MGKSETMLLDALVAPRNVALIGASSSPAKLTARPLQFLRQHGFSGQIYPVNPARDDVMGLRAYPSVSQIPDRVEHAYILLDADAAIAALEDCAAAGVKVVSVLADGFAEAGAAGRERQVRLTKIARDADILLIGPNSTGVVATHSGFACTTNAAFRSERLGAGRTAVLSQSGSVIGTLFSRGQARGIDFSTLVSVGNEAGTNIGVIGNLLLDDPHTDSFALFLETIREPLALARFARSAAIAGKPVTAYMIGRSDEGQALSVTHTGALTGSREAVSAFLRQIGIRQVDHFETLLDAPRILSRRHSRPGRPRTVTVVSTTGGGGAMVVDQISFHGVEIAGCSPASRTKLEAQGIALGHGKLVDVTLAGTKYETMKEVVSTLADDPATGLLLVVIGSSAQFDPEKAVRPIVDVVAENLADRAPIMAFALPEAPESMAMLEAGGVPAFHNVESCAESLSLYVTPVREFETSVRFLPDTVIDMLKNAAPGTMDEVQSGALFEALGIKRPDQIVISPDEDIPAELPVAFPVVVKLVSPDLPHKTDAGAICLNVRDRAELVSRIADMRRSAENYEPGYRLTGILVQEMRKGLGEMLVGLTHDPLVGAVITVAMGGVMTEIYRDAAVRVAPVSVDEAREMLAEIKGLELFRGFRGRQRGDLAALARAIADISCLALSDLVAEAEVNPILIGAEGQGVIMLDALVRRS
ncbi:acetate--CoA ligase family protein [Oricola nitratireducens]|uniref:acetate--CoA ligase family protein n=1 Tax=Oricola nitratireducens TaxID=2775868 RepID=UPI00186850B8|nr:acetate--CoA ligase family protein [Oricola nitratireducens]